MIFLAFYLNTFIDWCRAHFKLGFDNTQGILECLSIMKGLEKHLFVDRMISEIKLRLKTSFELLNKLSKNCDLSEMKKYKIFVFSNGKFEEISMPIIKESVYGIWIRKDENISILCDENNVLISEI